jgi:predicted dehydrogenase
MAGKAARPRVAFVGLGWIGRNRLAAVAEQEIVEIVGLADADADAREQARVWARDALIASTLEDVFECQPDGVVLATPSAMHAEQTIRALEAGAAVLCQKPLGRDTHEVRRVIDAARHANRLLGVDVSYRHTEGLSRIRDLVREGSIGRVYAIDLTFHNAYGPDKPWFYDMRQSGGGCLLDLGVHLVDFLHWTFDEPVRRASGHRFSSGEQLASTDDRVEDFAFGEIELTSGTVARVACSWKVSAGCDAQIGLYLYGTNGGLGFRNVNGSFYDFVAECYRGTETTALCTPPDAWGGRATVAWAQQLARSNAFDPEIEIAGRVAATIDELYGRGSNSREIGTQVDGQHATQLGVYADR